MSPEPSSAVPTIPYGASVPANIDVPAIVRDLKAQGVSGPAAQVPALQAVVADAKAKGHDIKVVVVTDKQPYFTYYRDIALAVQPQTGGTVIVLGPDSVGSSGPEFPRVVQEEASQNLTLTDPPGAARQMVDQLTGPQTNWSVITIVLTLLVLAAAVGARLVSKRRKAGAHASGASVPAPAATGADVHAEADDAVSGDGSPRD
ncbi:DUF6676 family protein [Gordonia sp. (in: high G+C Gram-positive bacteria)]|uniref:Rv1476 family membrane protein n=1 Tax=Gordonia sp. (in: high G+C Gram-positive bacteria) TaxID=84139 RepID=UPI0039E507F4